ncbi:MAG: hypothetical protein HYX75_04440 [Acidobacteria bacterium]|nr:hypothetical protein [Acidobacteriota bacterium]
MGHEETRQEKLPGSSARQWAVILLGFIGYSCSGGHVSEDALVRENLLRSVRMQERFWQSGTGDPIQYCEWYDGSLKLINEIAYKRCKMGNGELTPRTIRYLFIPGAPALFRDGSLDFVLLADGTAEQVGERKWTPVEILGEGAQTMMMWKTVDTDGKWIGLDREKLYELGEGGSPVQIAEVAYRDIILENGVKAAKVFMTRSLDKKAAWEGEVESTTYREIEGGRAEAVRKLEYRQVKLDGGREVPMLMALSLKGDGTWIGVRDGTVHRQK